MRKVKVVTQESELIFETEFAKAIERLNSEEATIVQTTFSTSLNPMGGSTLRSVHYTAFILYDEIAETYNQKTGENQQV